MSSNNPFAGFAGDLLGEIVTWDVKGSEVKLDVIRQALTAADLDVNVATDLTPKAAFTRACKELKKDRAIDKVRTEGSQIKFQLTKKKLEGEKMEYGYECLVLLDQETGAINCDESPEVAKFARELFSHAMDTRSVQDISRFVQKLFEQRADLYAIEPRKGSAYFVPIGHVEFTTKVENFLRGCGGWINRFPIPCGTDKGNACVANAVENRIETMLAEVEGTVAEWNNKTRKKSFESAAEEYEAIKAKVETMRAYLFGRETALAEKLEAAKVAMREKVKELTEEAEGDNQAAA